MLNCDWSLLPQELLGEIYRHLDTNIEHLYFRSVCQSWRSSALGIPSLIPILHLPNIPHQEIYRFYLHTQVVDDHGHHHDDDDGDDYDYYGGGGGEIIGVVDDDGDVVGEVGGEQCNGYVEYNLVESNIHVLHSSSFSKNPFYQAWLFKVHQTRRNVFQFLNPLSRTPIKISPWMFSEELNTLDTKFRISGVFKEYHLEREEGDSEALCTQTLRGFDRFILKRIVLSPTATVEDYVIVAMHSCGVLILFRSGDTKWTVINPGTRPPVHDVIHYKGQFYAVDSVGGICVVDPHTLALTQLVEPISDVGEGRKYLIESNGELFLINIFMGGKYSRSVGHWNLWKKLLKALACGYSFQKVYPQGIRVRSEPLKFSVYKLDERKQEWIGVNDLGDRIFFVGERSSFSISDSEFLLRRKGNCIFFADFSLIRDIYVMEHGYELQQPSTRVFNLEDSTIQTLADYPSYSHLFWPPPDFDCAAKLTL